MNHGISSTDGYKLHLTSKEYKAFKADEKKLFIKHYKIQRKARGVYANNKGYYVKSRKELGDWDSVFMEDLLT